MSGRLSPLVAKVYELLQDGAWHDRERIIREAGKIITPGEAARFAEQVRLASSGTGGERVKPRSMEFLVASGKRAMVRAVLNSNARIERHEGEQVVTVRLRPALVGGPRPRPARNPAPAQAKPRIRPDSSGQTTAHTIKAYEILADGQWHDREEVLAQMRPLIDEEIALRMTEYRRTWKYYKDGVEPPPRSRPLSREGQVEAGRRSIALEALQNNARVLRRLHEGRREVMLRPAQPSGAVAARIRREA